MNSDTDTANIGLFLNNLFCLITHAVVTRRSHLSEHKI